MHLVNSRIWLILIPALIAAAVLWLVSLSLKKKILKNAFSPEIQASLMSGISGTARRFKNAFIIAALFLAGFALLDPRWGTRDREFTIEGIDIVLVTDVSRSMLTPDVRPDRLSVSRKLANQILNQLVGNRVGITAFAGFGFNVIPLTADLDAASVFLNELSPDMIDMQGSNLEDALKKAMDLFEKETLTHKAIVVFTDGEDYEFSPLKQVEEAKKRGITIFTVGIGTPNGGKIPLLDRAGNVSDYLKDKNGQIVVSKLNESLLKQIATETGGRYYTGTEADMASLAANLDDIKKSRFGSGIFELMEPQFQYFLFSAVILLLLYLFLPDRKWKVNKKIVPVIAGFILLSLFLPARLSASDASKGVDLYKKGNFEDSLKSFQKALIRDPKNSKIRFNEGNTYYKLNDYDRAAQDYINLTNSDASGMNNRAMYNLGSTYLQKKDYAQAMRSFEPVLNSEKMGSPLYRKALQNFLFAKQAIKQQQNQNQDQKDKKKDQKDQKNNSGQNQNQTNQNQQQQPQTLSDTRSLLSLIAEEEKKHMVQKGKNQTMGIVPRNEW